MVPFGRYMHRVLGLKGWTVEQLADASGVDRELLRSLGEGHGFISVVDAVRVARALGSTLEEASAVLIGHSVTTLPIEDTPTLEDAQAFDELFQQRPSAAADILTHIISYTAARSPETLDRVPISAIRSLAAGRALMLDLDAGYPPVTLGSVRRMGLAGGVVSDADVAAYAARLRVGELNGAKARRMREALTRLQSTPLSAVKLLTVAEVDNFLKQQGVFFGLAWNLWPDTPRHVSLFLKLCRWAAWASGPGDDGWLGGLRTQLQQALAVEVTGYWAAD